MGWDRRGYYYHVRKQNGRVVREYVGGGRIGELAAQMDEIEREEREARRAEDRARRAAVDAVIVVLKQFEQVTDVLARAALHAAGFHQHKRGDWRKRRVQKRCTE